MNIIGLTGPSGAGKGALAAHFAARDIPIIDADRVYHDLLVPPSVCLDALAAEFGNEILAADGTLDRTSLAALVFGNGKQANTRRMTLNRITHQFVTERMNGLLSAYCEQGCAVAVIDAPLLIEAGLHQRCDLVVAVLADRNMRLKRLLARDGKSLEALSARIDAQPDDGFYRSHADVVVINDGDEARLRDEADAILSRLGLPL